MDSVDLAPFERVNMNRNFLELCPPSSNQSRDAGVPSTIQDSMAERQSNTNMSDNDSTVVPVGKRNGIVR